MSDPTPAQTEAQLADSYLDTAALGRKVANLALQQALTEAQQGKLRDPAKTATAAITASAIALDKRLLLQERPTQIHAIDPHTAVNALARKLGLSNSVDSSATEIPPTQATDESPVPTAVPNASPVPLLSESVEPKRAQPGN